MTTPKIGALRRTQAKGNSTTKICSLCTLLLIKTSSLLTLKSTVVEYLAEKLTKVELQSLKRGLDYLCVLIISQSFTNYKNCYLGKLDSHIFGTVNLGMKVWQVACLSDSIQNNCSVLFRDPTNLLLSCLVRQKTPIRY